MPPHLARALFLSGSIGNGHDVVAEACSSALEPFGVASSTLDSMALLGRGPAVVGEWMFRQALSVSTFYDAFHFSQLRRDGWLGRAADNAGVTRVLPAMRAELARFDPQLIVAVFATGAGVAARLRAEGLAARSIVVVTDSLAHRMWVHQPTDLFLVTGRAAAESVRQYWPEAPIRVISPPVRPGIALAPSKADARLALGVPLKAPCVLLMSGAWGLGPLDQVALALAAEGIWVLAVAGSNRRLERSLEVMARTDQRILAFGFTDGVPELMAACDVVVTSSGNTCHEARAIGRGMVIIDVVPGHGRENLQHQLELGGAAASLPTAGSIVRSVRAFLADPDRSQVRPHSRDAGAEFVEAVRSLGFELPSEAQQAGRPESDA